MEKKFTLFNSTFEVSNFKSFDEIMDIIRNEDEHIVAETKETFTHDDGHFKFEYKYVIEGEFCDGGTYYNISLVPLPQYVSKKNRHSTMRSFGYENEDELSVMELHFVGDYVMLAHTENETEENIDEEVLANMANTISILNSSRGFYLDKPQNLIGTSGWDILDNIINDIKY